jgi:hypothetical protein
MSEFKKHRSEDHPDLDILDEFENEDDLEDKLDDIAYFIGRIIIEFNSLESTLEYLIADQLTHAGNQDDRTFVFLAEMMFQGKAKALINLYGQIIEYGGIKLEPNELTKIQSRLEESARIRNEYAHAHWQELNSKGYVRVKTRASKKGIFQKYRLFDIEQMKKDLYYVMETPSIIGEFDEKIMDLLHERMSG